MRWRRRASQPRCAQLEAAARRKRERGRDAEQSASARAGRRSRSQAREQRPRTARQSLGGVIKTREEALAAEAPKCAPEAWNKAAERFRQAMSENESGDRRNAQRRAAEAEVLLRDAELVAIKGGMSERGPGAHRAGGGDEGREFAPRSLQAAKRHLAEAEQEIQRNRYDVGAAASQLAARRAL